MLDKLWGRLNALELAITRVQRQSVRSEITGAFARLNFADLPAAGKKGRVIFVIDGRKAGEGAGAGTGVCAYDDGSNWYRFSDDTVVAV